MSRPYISVIVPVYNVEKYLNRCIDSVLNQSYTDFELIAVNDGSPDGCAGILAHYAKKDLRVKPIHITNGGVSNARNVGISNSQGEYVYFLDADDWLTEDAFSALVQASDGADIVQGAYDVVYEDGKTVNNIGFANTELNGRDTILGEYLLGNIKQSVWNKLIKSEKIKGIQFDTELCVAEDTKFVYESCKASAKAKLIDTITYHYFIRSNSCMNTGLTEKHFQGLRVVDIQLAETKVNKDLYRKCVKKEAVLCFDLTYAIISQNKYAEKLQELRKRVVSKIKYIVFSRHFSLKFKSGVVLLGVCPKLFYKMFKHR